MDTSEKIKRQRKKWDKTYRLTHKTQKQLRDKNYYLLNRNKILARTKIYQKVNDKKIRHYRKRTAKRYKGDNLKKRYGLTIEGYNTLFKKQKGNCAICHKHQSTLKRSLAIDHNHKTKIVRGLLCLSCNIGLGHFKENIKYLKQAIKYIKRTRSRDDKF